MKTVEHLFPALCDIYGENWNAEYLARSCGELRVLATSHKSVPAFAERDVDLILLGSATERKQEQILTLLRPYTDRLRELIDRGTVFLVTGNAVELFGREIRDGERVIPALGLFDFTSVRYMDRDRHNSQFIAPFQTESGETLTLMGHKSQFSFSYGDFEKSAFLTLEKGVGMNPKTSAEGIRKNRFFATYSLGPFLILNPPFAKYLLRLLGLPDGLAFEKEAMQAYEFRLNQLRNEK